MGDHRATVTIRFEFHGKVYEINDAWWNWSPNSSDCDGVDQRVIDFFRKATEDGMVRYHEQILESGRERERELEVEERAELARLKAKYESDPQA